MNSLPRVGIVIFLNLPCQFARPLNMSGDDHLLPVINIYIVVQSETTNAGLNLVWNPSLGMITLSQGFLFIKWSIYFEIRGKISAKKQKLKKNDKKRHIGNILLLSTNLYVIEM